MKPPPASPAATLILFRQANGDEPEFLMIERSAAMVFAAGALVFPGGRVDVADDAFAAELGGEALLAAQIAAIRETIEEAGIAVGLTPAPDAAVTANLRAALAAGEPFAVLLRAAGLTIEPGALTPFARWRPDAPGARNFDTRFFVATAPQDAIATADGVESVRVLWSSARQLLVDADAGRNRMIFPTRRNLERLATLGSIAAAVDHARRFSVETITPWVETRGGEEWLCIPDDRGYPVTAERLADARRS